MFHMENSFSNIFSNILKALFRAYIIILINLDPRISRGCFKYPPIQFNSIQIRFIHWTSNTAYFFFSSLLFSVAVCPCRNALCLKSFQIQISWTLVLRFWQSFDLGKLGTDGIFTMSFTSLFL